MLARLGRSSGGRVRRETMRKYFAAVTGLMAFVAVSVSTPVHAVPLSAPAALKVASDSFEKPEAVCWGCYGYRPYYRPYYGYYRPYYRPYYGYYRPYYRPYYGYYRPYYRPYYGY